MDLATITQMECELVMTSDFFWFIVGALLLLVAFIGLLVGISSFRKHKQQQSTKPADDDYSRRYGGSRDDETHINRAAMAFLVFAVGFIFGGITLGLDSFTVIPARNGGVVNVLGNVTGTLPNGAHLVAPWSSVEKVDTTNKPLQLTDDGDLGNGCSSIAVRLATQTTACQDVFVQWQIDPHGDVADLWKAYRGSNDDLINNIQNNVILPRLRSEMQKVFSTYDPLAVLQGGQLQDTTEMQAPVKAALLNDMPPGVLLLDVRFGQIHYDSATQNKINAYSQAVADTKIAQQQEQTATAQAAANKELATSAGTNDPGVEYQNCLNLIASLAAKGQLGSLPPAFSCSQGSGTPVIVNSGAKS